MRDLPVMRICASLLLASGETEREPERDWKYRFIEPIDIHQLPRTIDDLAMICEVDPTTRGEPDLRTTTPSIR